LGTGVEGTTNENENTNVKVLKTRGRTKGVKTSNLVVACLEKSKLWEIRAKIKLFEGVSVDGQPG